MNSEDEQFEITTDPAGFEDVRSAIEEQGWPMASAELTMVPDSTVKVTAKDAQKTLKLLDALENQDDVQNLYSNVDIPEEILAELEG
jgi:transcriptional/translational regulatory protein YebC/TACO1